MSKVFLQTSFKRIESKSYGWNLYFFKIDRRNENPYYVYKHTFKDPDYLPNYIIELRDMILKYQIETLTSVQAYDGQNSKTSCDKLSTTDLLISTQWQYMLSSVGGAPRKMINGKYQGYILEGQPLTDDLPPVIIVKTGNPIINLNKKHSKIFNRTEEAELAAITDELCRLYLIADFVVIGNMLYSFNLRFEETFGLQKTFARIKNAAINQIISTAAFCNAEQVQKLMDGYTAPKTFLTLREQHVEKLKTLEGRSEISERLQLKLVDGKISITEREEANRLIKYLCYKIIQDKETDYLVEVSSVVNDNVLQR